MERIDCVHLSAPRGRSVRAVRVDAGEPLCRLPGLCTIALMETSSHGPLHGLRVLELGSFIAGPFAGQLLGDYGAEVLKVEATGSGDPMRRWGLTADGESLWWPAIARNKKSVAIDLREED